MPILSACQKFKKIRLDVEEMKNIPIYNLFDKVALDIVGPLFETKDGNRYALINIDDYLKWCEARPIKDHDVTIVATPLWAKCEDETHTPKSGDLESSGTLENLEFDFRGQNTSHWGVLYINGKVLKCKCPKWPRMSHLDICSPSYGQKKGRKSNRQFDSRPLKVGNRPFPDIYRRSEIGHWKALEESYNFGLDLTPIGGWSREI